MQELRDRSGLTRYQGKTVNGFLRWLESGPVGQFPHRVSRIEQTEGSHRSNPLKCWYLVKQKGMSATVPEMINQTRIRSRSLSSV